MSAPYAAEGESCETVGVLLFCSAATHIGKTSTALSGPVQVNAAQQQSFLQHQSLAVDCGVMRMHAWEVCESSSGLCWVFRRFGPVLQSVWCFTNLMQQNFAPGESGGSSRGESARRPREDMEERPL